MINYGKQFIDQSDIKAVIKVLKSSYLTQGPEIIKFEKKYFRTSGDQPYPEPNSPDFNSKDISEIDKYIYDPLFWIKK